jgi:hypothetical protein
MPVWRYGLMFLTLAALGSEGAGAASAAGADAGATATDEEFPAPPPNATPITDHFALSGIYFLGHASTAGLITPANGLGGTPFSAENYLGLTDEVYQPRIEIMFRLEERGRLRVDFFDLRRNADVDVASNVQYGSLNFVTGDQVQSMFSWRQMDLTYTYSFLRTERFELGAGAGLSLIEAEALAQIPGTPSRADFTGATAFGTLALDGTWVISRFWSLNARGQYLNLSTGSDSGTLGEYHADLQYRWRRNLAFGIGYERYVAELNVRNQNPEGALHLTIRGPEVFFRVSY